MTKQKNHKEEQKFNAAVMDLMHKSPTSFHVIKNNVDLLDSDGFIRLHENKKWDIKPGGKYYITRNNSTIIAFKIPKSKKINGFMIGASHSDHPYFKIINDCEISIEDNYKIATIEQYPKAIDYTWFDTPLSVAGRLIIKTEDGIKTKLVDVNRPLLMIPSLASHMQKEFSSTEELFECETRMRPIFSTNKNDSLISIISNENNIDPKQVVESELFVYQHRDPIIWGANNEFMSSRAIDNQLSVFSSLMAFLESEVKESIAVHAVFDNEEIGSCTAQGAGSTLLTNILMRVVTSIKIDKIDFYAMLPNSFILSIDNAHGFHPNYAEKYNKIARTYLGKGAVLKNAASYSYCTNAVSASILRKMAEKEEAKLQDYYNRPGVIPGSTLARFLTPSTSIIGADVGIAQLAMHSGYETCSAYDALQLKKLIKSVYSSSLIIHDDGNYTIK